MKQLFTAILLVISLSLNAQLITETNTYTTVCVDDEIGNPGNGNYFIFVYSFFDADRRRIYQLKRTFPCSIMPEGTVYGTIYVWEYRNGRFIRPRSFYRFYIN